MSQKLKLLSLKRTGSLLRPMNWLKAGEKTGILASFFVSVFVLSYLSWSPPWNPGRTGLIDSTFTWRNEEATPPPPNRNSTASSSQTTARQQWLPYFYFYLFIFCSLQVMTTIDNFSRTPPKTKPEMMINQAIPDQDCVMITCTFHPHPISCLLKRKAHVWTPKMAENELKCLLCLFLWLWWVINLLSLLFAITCLCLVHWNLTCGDPGVWSWHQNSSFCRTSVNT
jgi:hypothetical protein